MGNDELISIIQEKYKNGERKDAIKQSLMESGWDESEIDSVIAQIQHEAIKQMPVISSLVTFLDTMDKKTANASPKLIAAVLAGSAFFVLLLAFGLYVLLDPLGSKTSDRDKQRETDFIKLRNAIERYNISKGAYPNIIDKLVPDYIQSIPQDPKTGSRYTYNVLSGTMNYQLCVVFETRPVQCVASTPVDVLVPQSEPTVVPTVIIEASPSAKVTQPL